MLTSSPPKKDARIAAATALAVDGSNDLRFISELGRSLLFTVHPKKVAARVAEAIRNGVDANTCVFVAELENIGLISAAFSQESELDSGFLHRSRFEKWLALLPPQIAYSESFDSEFLIDNSGHRLEYISPLHINGEIKGAIVTSFA